MTTPESRRASTIPTDSYPVTPQLKRLAFTCTFCWHVSSTSPRVIGRSARLACEPCYKALLNLSICWVCGEVVVRGDDCVSLGWCFWHKSCYGCLICGNRRVIHGVTVAEVFAEGNGLEGVEQSNGLAVTRGQAKEIEQIPLCAHCYVEVGAEQMDTLAVVNGALQRADCPDGDLSWKRYEDCHPDRGDALRLERTSALQLKDICPAASADSGVNVSIRDPTAPAFKPNPTKPIPRWMAARPNHGDDTSDYGLEAEPTPDVHAAQPPPAELPLQRRHSSYGPPTDRTVQPPAPIPELVPPAAPPDTTPRPVTVPIATPQPVPMAYPKIFRYSRGGFVDSESLKRPSSRLDRIREESSHVESRTPSPYLTPPEWPIAMYGNIGSAPELAAHSVYEDATSPEPACIGASGQTSILSETSSHTLASLLSPPREPTPSQFLPRLSVASEPSSLPQHPRLPRKSTMLKAKIAAHHPAGGHTALPMSSEFLERYGVAKGRETPRTSALLKKMPPSSRRSSHEPQAITALVTKNSRSGATTGPVDEITVVTETEHSSTPTQFSFDSMTGSIALHDGPAFERVQLGRRRSLQAELLRLFGGQQD